MATPEATYKECTVIMSQILVIDNNQAESRLEQRPEFASPLISLAVYHITGCSSWNKA